MVIGVRKAFARLDSRLNCFFIFASPKVIAVENIQPSRQDEQSLLGIAPGIVSVEKASILVYRLLNLEFRCVQNGSSKTLYLRPRWKAPASFCNS